MNTTTTHTGPWTEVVDAAAHTAALDLCQGKYQRDLLMGHENLSGSSLVGAVSRWGASYSQSRRSLLARMTAAGILWSERRGSRRSRILVIGR